VALALWLIGQVSAGAIALDWWLLLWLAGFILIEGILYFAARDALEITVRKLESLLGVLHQDGGSR
jgi:hypothetical protein